MHNLTNELMRDGASGDPWGDVRGTMFAYCDVMTVTGLSDYIPSECEYRPSPILTADMIEDWPDAYVIEVIESGEITGDDMQHDLKVLNRYADLLKMKGMDY